jgi:hypothetical protein
LAVTIYAKLRRLCLTLVIPFAGIFLWFSQSGERLRTSADYLPAWILLMIVVGSAGVLLVPFKPAWKIAALLFYAPAMLALLATLSLVLACLKDAGSCP